jgi:hypothetical protein
MTKQKTVDLEKEYFTTNDVRILLKLKTTDQAINWLKREGAALKKGGRYYTTRPRLMSAFPDVFQSLGR